MSYRLRARTARFLLAVGRFKSARWLIGVLAILFGAGRRRVLRLKPLQDLDPISDRRWAARGSDPQFVVDDLYAVVPKGWCYFDARIEAEGATSSALYVDTGDGFSPIPVLEIQNTDPVEASAHLVRIPASTRSLRFDPVDTATRFTLGEVTLTQAPLFKRGPRSDRAANRAPMATIRAGGARLGSLLGRGVRRVGRAGGTLAAALLQRSRAERRGLVPERDVVRLDGERWHSLGSEPRFKVEGERYPAGWCGVSVDVASSEMEVAPALYASSRKQPVQLDATWRIDGDTARGVAYVPWRTGELWWRPGAGTGTFAQPPVLELAPLKGWRQLRRPSLDRHS